MKHFYASGAWGRSRPRYRSPLFATLRLASARYAGSAAISSLLLLTACGSSAPERYTLTPQPMDSAVCHSRAGLKIYEPDAAPGLDGWRIVVIDTPNHVTRYKGVAWASNVATLVQHYLTESIEQSGLFATVSTDSDTLPGDYSLESKLSNFEVDLTGAEPVIRIRLSATLVRGQENRPIGNFRLSREAPIAGADMQGIVAMFNEQMHSIAQELAAGLASKTGCR